MLNGRFVNLRVMEKKDIEQVRRWRNSPGNYTHFANRDFITDTQQENWFQSKVGRKDDLRLMILNRKTGKPIGVTHLEHIDHRNRNAGWGIYIADLPHRKRIYAAEAVLLLFDYAFNYLNLHKVYGNTLAGNSRGREFHRFVGFVEEATFSDHVFLDGHYENLLWISLLENRWKTRRAALERFVETFKR